MGITLSVMHVHVYLVATGEEMVREKDSSRQRKVSEFYFESRKIDIVTLTLPFSCCHCFVEATIKMPSCDFLKIYQWVRRRELKAATVCYILCLFG